MRSKIVYIITAIFIIIISIGVYKIDIEDRSKRVHQHLENEWKKIKTNESEKGHTNLPIISIETDGKKIPGNPILENNKRIGYETTENGETTIKASFSVIDQKNGNNQITDNPYFTSMVQIKYRGNSSRHFDKKSYSIHLVSKEGKDREEEIAGMSPHNEWVLSSSFLDRSLLRDYLGLNISGEIMEYAPNVRYCEVFVDGKYQGLYLLMESVSKGKGRINIKKPEKNKSITSYIVCWDRDGKVKNKLNDYFYYTYRSDISAFGVAYPGQNLMTNERKEFIWNDINKLERVLESNKLTDGNKSYEELIDSNAFAEYFIINEFFRNVDAGQFSTYYYKDILDYI